MSPASSCTSASARSSAPVEITATPSIRPPAPRNSRYDRLHDAAAGLVHHRAARRAPGRSAASRRRSVPPGPGRAATESAPAGRRPRRRRPTPSAPDPSTAASPCAAACRPGRSRTACRRCAAAARLRRSPGRPSPAPIVTPESSDASVHASNGPIASVWVEAPAGRFTGTVRRTSTGPELNSVTDGPAGDCAERRRGTQAGTPPAWSQSSASWQHLHGDAVRDQAHQQVT